MNYSILTDGVSGKRKTSGMSPNPNPNLLYSAPLYDLTPLITRKLVGIVPAQSCILNSFPHFLKDDLTNPV